MTKILFVFQNATDETARLHAALSARNDTDVRTFDLSQEDEISSLPIWHEEFDGIMVRSCGRKATKRDVKELESIIQHYCEQGAISAEDIGAIKMANRRAEAQRALEKTNVRVPTTIYCDKKSNIDETVTKVNCQFRDKEYVVFKKDGCCGHAVQKVSMQPDKLEQAVLEMRQSYSEEESISHEFIVQEYLPCVTDDGQAFHYRFFVVDGRVVNVCKLVSTKSILEEFRSNGAQGATITEITPCDYSQEFGSYTEVFIAQAKLAASSQPRLNVNGVDILSVKGLPVVLETNENPGFVAGYRRQDIIDDHVNAVCQSFFKILDDAVKRNSNSATQSSYSSIFSTQKSQEVLPTATKRGGENPPPFSP